MTGESYRLKSFLTHLKYPYITENSQTLSTENNQTGWLAGSFKTPNTRSLYILHELYCMLPISRYHILS